MAKGRCVERKHKSKGGSLHPNPQFARPTWQSLDGIWQFAIDDRNAHWPTEVKWTGKILVPFAPETSASGVAHEGFMRGCWYRRMFSPPRLRRGQRLILHFGAVDYFASVWVNGRLAATHEGGYTPLACDITPHLRPGRRQEVTVHAQDDPQDLAKPRGKQDWQERPHSIWYPRTTGIWQSVWLEVVGGSYIDSIAWEGRLEGFVIEMAAHIAGAAHGLELRVRLRARGRELADDRCAVLAGQVHRQIVVLDPGIDDYRNELLWSPESPTLIEAELELSDAAGRRLDLVHSYTAMRSAATQGDRFILNGRPRYLRLVLDQGYWPQSGLTPPNDDAIRRDVELVKEMGFNGVRAHQRIPDPRYLYWADKLGLLVWEEMPSPYRFTPLGVQRLCAQWAEAIARDRSHPCVIVYVPMNESWGVPDLPSNPAHRDMVRTLYHLTKALDPSRPVVGNDGWEMDVTDIIAIHDYDGDPRSLRRRYRDLAAPQRMLQTERPGHRMLLLEESAYHGQPIMLTEFGGIALREGGTWGYSQAADAQDLLHRYRALLDAVHSLEHLAGFCYTQFADTYQEANGLLRADRTSKIPIEEIRKITLGRER